MNYELLTINKNGNLLYNGNKIFGTGNCELFKNYYFKEKLGHGANGIALIAIHKFLEIEHVIKIYSDSISEKKAIEEIKKNSKIELQSINAINFDGGKINSPFQSFYSIMEKIDNHIPLKNWLSKRDDFLNSANDKDSYFEKVEEFALTQSLNMSISLLKVFSLKNETSIVHGDLNNGNILVNDSFKGFNISEYKRIWTSLSTHTDGNDCHLAFINSKTKGFSTGTLYEINTRLIDMGTSKADNTNREVGEIREAWFIYENIRKILKPFFLKTNIKFNALFRFKTDSKTRKNFFKDELLDYKKLVIELSRLTLLLNYMLGLVYCSGINKLDFKMLGRSSNRIAVNVYVEEDFSELLTTDLIEASLIHPLSLLAKKKNESNYIEWDMVWKYLTEKYPSRGFEILLG